MESNDTSRTPATGQLPEKWLAYFLMFVGGVSQLAFVAAFMPSKWIHEITEELLPDPFPAIPLGYYLARHLSLLYGFLGIGLLVIAFQLKRYRDLVSLLAIGTIAFGLTQGIADWMSGLPPWWTLGESISTVIGGMLMLWLDRSTQRS